MCCTSTLRWLIVLTLHPAIAVLSTRYRSLGSCSRAAGWSAATSCFVLVFGRRQQGGSAGSTGRRPKSAKARSRGRLGRDDAASYGWLPGLIRSQSTKFLHDRLVVWHNFSVVARSLLIGTINLGLPWDFNELHVAKISLVATSALIPGKQPLYCMGRADLCVSGEAASISSNYCVLVVSPMP